MIHVRDRHVGEVEVVDLLARVVHADQRRTVQVSPVAASASSDARPVLLPRVSVSGENAAVPAPASTRSMSNPLTSNQPL